MARICVIRAHHYPRDTRVLREVHALLEAGHEVDVICLREPGEPAREQGERLRVWRLPLRHAAGAGPGRLLAEYAGSFTLSAALVGALHARRRFDLVQVNSVPDALVFAALVPRLAGARVLLDLQEAMPEFFATRFQAPGHPAVRGLERIEQAAIRFADAAITPSVQLRQAFVGRGADPQAVTVVMDGADESVFDPARHPPAPRRDGRFVLVSHGTIEPQYGLDTVIAAVARLGDEIPGLRLEVFGDGSQREPLRRLARELGVQDRVRFSDGFVAIDALVAAIAAADAGVVAIRRDPFRDLTIPGKMLDFVAMGRPMVVSRTRSVLETFGEDCFEAFESGDVEGLARAIRRLHDDPARAQAQAARAAQVARPYRWARQREHYLGVIDELTRRSPAGRPRGP